MEELQERVPVSPDETVAKVVLRQGAGEPPSLHARCLVHYVGRLQSSDAIFMDSREEGKHGEPVIVVAGRDSTARERGLSYAVQTMLAGEKSRVWVPWPHGFGAEGSFSFPTVPPRSDLVYDLELLAWEPALEAESARGMLFEERLEAAARRRTRGAALFKEGDVPGAAAQWALGLSFVDEELTMQLMGAHLEAAVLVRGALQRNLAAALLRQERWAEAAEAAAEAVGADGADAVAWFRRGAARLELGQLEDAVRDLERARALCPDDGGIARKLNQARAAVREQEAATKSLYAGMMRGEGGGKRGGAEEQGLLAEEQNLHTSTRWWQALVAFFSRLWAILATCWARLLGSGTREAEKEHRG